MVVVNDNNFWGGAIDYAKNKIAQIKQNMMCMWDIITWFGGGGDLAKGLLVGNDLI